MENAISVRPLLVPSVMLCWGAESKMALRQILDSPGVCSLSPVDDQTGESIIDLPYGTWHVQ